MTAPAHDPARDELRSTAPEGLDRDHPVMRLWTLAKEHGTWDPAAIDLTEDRRQFAAFSEKQRDASIRQASLFLAGEESVVRDLLPTMQVVSEEGRLEEEMFLATFLWEEAKHVEFFRRLLETMAPDAGHDFGSYLGPSHRRIFMKELPEAMNRLRTDRSLEAQARAGATYHMIVEGVLAETGYRGYYDVMERLDVAPGTRRGVELVQRDESRHLAYGIYLLSRLVSEGGDPVWEAVQDQMETLLPLALGVVEEVFDPYDEFPFPVDVDTYLEYARSQYQKRTARLERAREQSLDEVADVARDDVG